MIGIKKKLSEDWEVVEWDYGFKLINKKESEMLVTVYNNVGMDAIEKKIKKEVREMENIIEKIIVLGDMNARLGESDVTKIFNASEKQRKSKDKKLNAEGKKLLSLCEELVLELERKNNFNVGVEENKDKCKGLRKLEEERLVWKKDNVMDYAEAAYEEWQRRRENNDELQWNDIKELIHNAAKAAGMSKKPNRGKRKGGEVRKEWFNNECKRLRSVVWEKLKNMLKKEQDIENLVLVVEHLVEVAVLRPTVYAVVIELLAAVAALLPVVGALAVAALLAVVVTLHPVTEVLVVAALLAVVVALLPVAEVLQSLRFLLLIVFLRLLV
ncbi:hypothetical protein KQX54_012845 [Cotesia glomerata]|uniref:Uncharacterized protein n=1 Tax=Cotesia glomerata TaxID=32391 RepID=A0AAV7IJD8_COTGL|nr:hypothetical protein KQX54_012845 [Cotesia glomerata]